MPISGYFDTAFASSGTKTAVPDAVQPDGSVSYAQGYGVDYTLDPATNPSALDVEQDKFNQLLFDITSAIQQYQQVGTPPFITSAMNGGTPYSYSKYDRVISGGITYQSLSNANTDTPPSANWQADLSISGVPSGAIIDFAGTSAPSGWLLCFGQAVSRTTYAALFTAVGTVYGPGDGSTTFNLPDYRGRIGAGVDNMGGSAANRITNTDGVVGTTLGSAGGEQTHVLVTGELAAHSHTATVTDGGHTHIVSAYLDGAGSTGPSDGLYNSTSNTFGGGSANPATQSATTGISVANSSTGSDTGHNNLQPTIMINKIIKT